MIEDLMEVKEDNGNVELAPKQNTYFVEPLSEDNFLAWQIWNEYSELIMNFDYQFKTFKYDSFGLNMILEEKQIKNKMKMIDMLNIISREYVKSIGDEK